MPLSVFFPAKGDTKSGELAQRTCFSCPVRKKCLDYKRKTNSEFGIWGGLYPTRGKNN